MEMAQCLPLLIQIVVTELGALEGDIKESLSETICLFLLVWIYGPRL